MKKVRPVPAGLVIPAAAAKPDPIDNTALVTDFRAKGGLVVHIRPKRNPYTGKWKRGGTFAFITKGSRMEVSSALQHSADSFSKKVGTKTAIEHFNAGKTIHLPLSERDAGINAIKYDLSLMF